jgi:TfoX/Sxy family transcriptional regulator of competence genes
MKKMNYVLKPALLLEFWLLGSLSGQCFWHPERHGDAPQLPHAAYSKVVCPRAIGPIFALIAEDRLYFKVNDTTRPDFERLGMEPFRPFGEDSAMGYYEVPAGVVEDSVQVAAWMKQAIDVAAQAKGKKQKGVKRSPP